MDKIDNKTKEKTYRELYRKYNKAIKEEFYFEAICIDYALLEDRLKSLLYYLGVVLERTSIKLDCQKTKKQIKEIYTYGKSITFTKMNVKIKLIKSFIEWFESNPSIEDKYLKLLYNSIKKLDINKLLECLNNIEKWCYERNVLIHASASRNIFDLYNKAVTSANEGMEYVRIIDSEVKKLKRNNSLRKNMNMKL